MQLLQIQLYYFKHQSECNKLSRSYHLKE